MHSFAVHQLSVDDGIEVYEMLQRIGSNENDFTNDAKGLSFEQFKEWLKEKDSWSKGESLPEGYVRQWIFWLIVDAVPVGYGKIREKITEKSAVWGGNIGYAIDSTKRGLGYGTILFNGLLNEAKRLGVTQVLSTVKIDNYASRRVNEKCGGVMVKENEENCYYSFNL